MSTDERHIEVAEACVRREAESAIAAICAGLACEGEDVCVDCDEAIPAARKAALPSAERCIRCQTRHERTRRDSGY